MNSPLDWSGAYARQAKADIDAWDVLSVADHLPESQQLHFLQMACEKLVKAYLCSKQSDPRNLQSSHAYIAKNLPVIIQDEIASLKEPAKYRWLIQSVKLLAREIELLAPAVDDDGRRPDNCEYPWEDSTGNLHVPATHQFSNLGLLEGSTGILIMKLIKSAILNLLPD